MSDENQSPTGIVLNVQKDASVIRLQFRRLGSFEVVEMLVPSTMVTDAGLVAGDEFEATITLKKLAPREITPERRAEIRAMFKDRWTF